MALPLGQPGSCLTPPHDVRIEQTVQPIQENVKKYEAWMPVFDKAYHALCDMYTEIAKTELDSI